METKTIFKVKGELYTVAAIGQAATKAIRKAFPRTVPVPTPVVLYGFKIGERIVKVNLK